MIRIGITSDFEIITDKRGQQIGRYVLQQAYCNAVAQAGGLPIMLPYLPPERAAEYLANLEGLVISGGDFDVPPAFYNETPRAGMGGTWEHRSTFERALLQGALQADKPILGVCGGMQLLNVVCGGSLFQDLRERPNTGVHQQPHDKRLPLHSVTVAADSRLASLTKSAALEVNSTHHQVLNRLGTGLSAVAVAPDGVVEAIELSGKRFAIGVQWHPEAMSAPVQQEIYNGFVRACTPA